MEGVVGRSDGMRPTTRPMGIPEHIPIQSMSNPILYPHPVSHPIPTSYAPPGPSMHHRVHTLPQSPLLQKVSSTAEQNWMHLGVLSRHMNEAETAQFCFENVLRRNPVNVQGLIEGAHVRRTREDFSGAVEYYKRALTIDADNGEVWEALGHCHLVLDDVEGAYGAYQRALHLLNNAGSPTLWYGIGILYERCESLEYAENAFSFILKDHPQFERIRELYFRLGGIYRRLGHVKKSIDCFRFILVSPPPMLTQADIWMQIGLAYEAGRDEKNAKNAYEKALEMDPEHTNAMRQLGWLLHLSAYKKEQDTALSFLTKATELDPENAKGWYLLGRCYMAQLNYVKAFEAYRVAVSKDDENPTYWCSIGVLFYQMNQFRDALDAYSRALRLNPNLSEVWYDLGTLYDSCNQTSDAIHAFQQAAALEPSSQHIRVRLNALLGKKDNLPPTSTSTPSDDNERGWIHTMKPHNGVVDQTRNVGVPTLPTKSGKPDVTQTTHVEEDELMIDDNDDVVEDGKDQDKKEDK